MSKYKFIVSGGGTGGHIFPALSIAGGLRARFPDSDILFVGAEGKMEMEKVPEAGYHIVGLPVAGFHRGEIWRNISFPFKLLRSMLKAKKVVKDFKPDVVIGVGGYASGPVLRASGVKWDLRKADPYSIYDRFTFDVPVGAAGDCYDRYWIKILEMQQSLRILEQAVAQLPGSGPICADVPALLHPPAGEVYTRIEAPKGELGFYIVSDNSIAPYRLHIRSSELINLTAFRDMVIGWKIADLILTFGSIDICMGEIDR